MFVYVPLKPHYSCSNLILNLNIIFRNSIKTAYNGNIKKCQNPIELKAAVILIRKMSSIIPDDFIFLQQIWENYFGTLFLQGLVNLHIVIMITVVT